MRDASVNIFILIDALGWDYIKNRPFLDDIAVTKRPVKSILGFSSGVIPSILTGKYPQEHKHWSLYFYSPQTSPFKWTRHWVWLPGFILRSRLFRKIVEEISKRCMGYTGYFESYLIPIELLHLYDISEKKHIYSPSGIRRGESIFDILKALKREYRSYTYPLKDSEIFEHAVRSLQKGESDYYFLYLSESDSALHADCSNAEKTGKLVFYYESCLKQLYEVAKKTYTDVNFYVFSDHSMAHVKKSVDLKREISSLDFKTPQDYVAFYDSTMARFWFSNAQAKQKIEDLLQKKQFGHILSRDEVATSGIDFKDNMYGETIFLMNTGIVINPSFMGNKVPCGMHGFSADDDVMDAMLVSNRTIEPQIRDVKDFFIIMSDAVKRKKKLKVLYFLNSLIRGGVENHVIQLINRIDKSQFEPVLVCPQTLIDLLQEELKETRIAYYPICIRKWRSVGEIGRFLKILKAERPDIVHSHLFFATLFAAPIAKFAGVPCVIETAHLREGWRKGIKKLYWVDRLFYRFTDKIIAVSDAVRNYLIDIKKLPPDRIIIIRNGVDLEKFKPSEESKKTHELRVGVIGRLEPQKGHKYLFEALKMLNGKLDNVKTSVIGEGSLRESLEELCSELNIDNRVEFLGFRSDVKDLLNELDIVVLPSLYEGLPLIALEAGAMAKPLIATDVDGTNEVVINNTTGILVPPADCVALKTAIERLLDDVSYRSALGMMARNHIVKRFAMSEQIRKTENLYTCSARS